MSTRQILKQSTSFAMLLLLTILAISSQRKQQVLMMPTSTMTTSTMTNEPQQDPIRTLHYHFDKHMEPHLQLNKFNSTLFNGNTVSCNDGSPAGYYKRLNNHSKSWIIYLQGGGFCGSDEACQQRWRFSAQLMSSNYWPKSRSGEFIFSIYVYIHMQSIYLSIYLSV